MVKTSLRQPHHLSESSLPTKNELDQIKASLASLNSVANAQLREQSNAAENRICIDALLLLSEDKRATFLSFSNYDTTNDRLRFIQDVLPFLVASLSAESAEKSGARDLKQTLAHRTSSPPHPVSGLSRKQRRNSSGQGESYWVTKPPRRSQRITRCADDRQDYVLGDWKKRKRSSKGRGSE